jgi:hypothetical protein
MVDKLEAYVAPLRAEGVALSPLLRVGNPREVIVEVATSLKAELLIRARSQGSNPWQTQVMALFGAPLAPLAFSSGAGLLSPV